ncbi:MAG: hypothetical protein MJZ09_02805 [Bacteroidales bacterium]|nr:hypothetical protein [Bacteroidales bacterium]
MKTKTKISIAAAAGAVLLVFVIIALSRYEFYEATLKYGLIFFGMLFFGYLIWKAFIKNSREDLKRSEKLLKEKEQKEAEMEKTIRDLSRELAENRHSRLNVMELNPILHIAVLNVNTSFTRSYVREEGEMTFNGALRVDINAEYGARLEDARFKYDPISNTLSIADFKPGLISYSKKQLTWDIARSYRSRPNILGIERADISDQQAELFTNQMCEKLRGELEKEIDDRQVAEFNWLSPMISQQVVDIFKLMIGRETLNIAIEEKYDDTFVDLNTFRAQLAQPLEEVPQLPDVQEIIEK